MVWVFWLVISCFRLILMCLVGTYHFLSLSLSHPFLSTHVSHLFISPCVFESVFFPSLVVGLCSCICSRGSRDSSVSALWSHVIWFVLSFVILFSFFLRLPFVLCFFFLLNETPLPSVNVWVPLGWNIAGNV